MNARKTLNMIHNGISSFDLLLTATINYKSINNNNKNNASTKQFLDQVIIEVFNSSLGSLTYL